MREVVELDRSGDRCNLAPEGRDRLADEEPAKRGVPAKRAEVDRQPAEPAWRPYFGRLQVLEELAVVVWAGGRLEEAAGAAAEVGEVDAA